MRERFRRCSEVQMSGAEIGMGARPNITIGSLGQQLRERRAGGRILREPKTTSRDQIKRIIGPAAVRIFAIALGRLLDTADVCFARIPAPPGRAHAFRVRKLAARVVEAVEVAATRNQKCECECRGSGRGFHSATHRCSWLSKNLLIERLKLYAILSWKADVPSSLASSGFEMNAISTRTAGISAPTRTLKPACLTPRLRPG